MAGKFPESYADPLYDQVDAANEQKLGIPVGLLSSIRTAGEKTDASRVSSAGATTPYQFIAATRKAILDKYGIDVTLSPENASEGAGLLLQESLKRSKGDVETAVRQYHGGTDPKNWGKVNDAYAGRVLAAQGAAKTDALASGFAKFMADNPAVPAAAAPAAAPAPATDALGAGFGQWLAQKNAPSLVDQIPLDPGAAERMAAEPARAPQADPTLVDKLVGGGETALTLATGATTGTLGMLAGGAAGLVGNLTNGRYGMKDGVEAGMQQGAESLTYAPRTEVGREYAGNVGKVLAAALPAFPLTAELGAIGRGVGAAATGARDISAAGVQRIRTAAPAIAERVERTLRRNPDPATPTPGTQASGGSAGTDIAAQRRTSADEMGIKLTAGQETRDPSQLRFELETAKGESGAKFRERYSDQNAQIDRHFDNLVDMTGAETADALGTGRAVDAALRQKMLRDKAQVRVAYTEARKAGEMEAPVQLDTLVDHLNESAPDAATAPLLDVARKRALQLGIATEVDGQLVAAPVPLKIAETMRQAIGRATDYEATNMRQSAIIKGLIDTATEGAGGTLYRAARRTRENFAKQYEDRAVVSSLLNNKRGTGDRKVALEDVFDHTILKGSRADVGHVRRVLQTGGEEGQQAWKELQGATVNWIKDQAFANSATDMRGNTILSVPKLEKALKKLDADGKLDFMFGKQGAQHMRDINDLAKVIYTAPPGTTNPSGSISVLMTALAEAGVNGSMFGLPVPIVSGIRLLAKHSKDRKLQARIERALNNRTPPPPPARPPGATVH